jgi:hypothetical protein
VGYGPDQLPRWQLTRSNQLWGPTATLASLTAQRRRASARWLRHFMASWDVQLAPNASPRHAEMDGGGDLVRGPPEHRRRSPPAAAGSGQRSTMGYRGLKDSELSSKRSQSHLEAGSRFDEEDY